MGRSIWLDPLQSYPFWLMDLGPSDLLSLPVLTPLFGFASCTAPEIQGDVQEINEGNWFFTRKVMKRASVSPLTLQRGTRFFDSDFWRWMLTAVSGNTAGFELGLPLLRIGGPTYRRDLLLIQYFAKDLIGYGPLGSGAHDGMSQGLTDLVGGSINIAAAGLAGGIAGQTATSIANLVGFNALFTAVQALTGVDQKIGAFDFTARVPARMWLLHDCIPTRYKVGSDFDAASGAISLAELDLMPDYFEEIALSA